MTEVVDVRLKATLGPGFPAPGAQHPGKGSAVTVVAILPKPDRSSPYARRLVYAIDEWGKFHEFPLDDLVFDPDATHAVR